MDSGQKCKQPLMTGFNRKRLLQPMQPALAGGRLLTLFPLHSRKSSGFDPQLVFFGLFPPFLTKNLEM